MKKIGVFALVLGILCAGSAFAKGPGGLSAIGVYGNFGGSSGMTEGGVGLSLKFGSFPVIGLKYNIGTPGYLGASVDYYILDSEPLVDSLSYFLGAGLYGGMRFSNPASGDFGLRIPIGLQLWVVRKLELFISAVPYVPLLPSLDLGLGGEVGLRVHF